MDVKSKKMRSSDFNKRVRARERQNDKKFYMPAMAPDLLIGDIENIIKETRKAFRRLLKKLFDLQSDAPYENKVRKKR
jgi:hypothetical protein